MKGDKRLKSGVTDLFCCLPERPLLSDFKNLRTMIFCLHFPPIIWEVFLKKTFSLGTVVGDQWLSMENDADLSSFNIISSTNKYLIIQVTFFTLWLKPTMYFECMAQYYGIWNSQGFFPPNPINFELHVN